eukprot:g1515.t1
MVAMDCEPELAVVKRKTVSSTEMAKRLRRFVRENQIDDEGADRAALDDQGAGEDGGNSGRSRPPSGQLLCRIPEETLFQLQQIYEALEESSGIGSGGSGAGSKLNPTSNAPSLKDLISSSAAAGAGGEDELGPSATEKGDGDASVRTPDKTSKKRGRDGELPPPATAEAKASRGQDPSPKKKKKKKDRRKSNPT